MITSRQETIAKFINGFVITSRQETIAKFIDGFVITNRQETIAKFVSGLWWQVDNRLQLSLLVVCDDK